jgi:hypothetical protein
VQKKVNSFHQHIGCQQSGRVSGGVKHTTIIPYPPNDIFVSDETIAPNPVDKAKFTDVF